MSSTGLSASMDSVLSGEVPQSVVADGRFVTVKDKNAFDQTAKFVLEDSAGNKRDVKMSYFPALTFNESDIDESRRIVLWSQGGLLHTTRSERYMLRSPNTGDIFDYYISGGDNILIPKNSDRYGLYRFLERVYSRPTTDTSFTVGFEVSPILDQLDTSQPCNFDELVRPVGVDSSSRSDEVDSGNVDDDSSSESSESDLENVTEDIAYDDISFALPKNIIIISGKDPSEGDLEDIIASEEDSDRLRRIMRNYVIEHGAPYNNLHQMSYGVAYAPNDDDGEYFFPALDDNILVACKILKKVADNDYVAANAHFIDFGVYEMSSQKYRDLCQVRERNGQGSEAIPVVLFNEDGSSFTIVDASELEITGVVDKKNHYSLRNNTTSV